MTIDYSKLMKFLVNKREEYQFVASKAVINRSYCIGFSDAMTEVIKYLESVEDE